MKSKIIFTSLLAFFGVGLSSALLLNQQAANADTPAQITATPDYLSFHTEDESNNIEIFRAASPSVVYVTNTTMRRSSPYSRNLIEVPQGTGTGFVWDSNGLIVTNSHVINDAEHIIITLQDQSNWDAEVVGYSEDKDLALLRIKAPEELLTPLPLGDSSLLEVGRKVIAIGNPFGLDTTLTVGVVSALEREIPSLTDRTIRNVIQTDASINPGNSGGPLLNSLGQLIGVNTQIVSPSGASAGIGFAIPVNTVKKVIPQLLEYGKEVRPILGVRFVADRLARQQGIEGVVVEAVYQNMPADTSGIIGLQQNYRGDVLLGDVIVAINNISVEDSDDILNELEQHKAGDRVTVTTERNNKKMEFKLELAAPI